MRPGERSGVAASRPAPGSSWTSGPSCCTAAARQLAQRRDVDRQVLLGGVDELAVRAAGEDRAADELERAHDVLERRAQQAGLVALDGEVVDERDERLEQAVAAAGRTGGRRAPECAVAAGRGSRRARSWRAACHSSRPLAARAAREERVERRPLGAHARGVPAELRAPSPRRRRRRRPRPADRPCRGRAGAGRRPRATAPSPRARRAARARRGCPSGGAPSRRTVVSRPARDGAAARGAAATRSTARSATARAVVYLTPCRLTSPAVPSSRSWSTTRGAGPQPVRHRPPPAPGPRERARGPARSMPAHGKRPRRLVEELERVAGRRGRRLVGGADDRASLPGHQEQEAALAPRADRQRDGRRPAAGRGCGRAAAAAGARPDAAARGELVHPRARRRSPPAARAARACSPPRPSRTRDAGDAAARAAQQLERLGVVGDSGPGVRRGVHERRRAAARCSPPARRARARRRQAARRQARHQARAPRRRRACGQRGSAARRAGRGCGRASAGRSGAGRARAPRGRSARGPYRGRRKGSGSTSSGAIRSSVAPLARGLAQAADVGRCRWRMPAVDRLQAVPGGAGAEVLALDERHGEPALRGVPGHGGAVDPAADHDAGPTRAPRAPRGRASRAGRRPPFE